MFRLLALLVTCVSAAPPVKVQWYGEALCPGCHDFLVGPLNSTLDANGVAAIMDFTYYPFGNAYYNTKKCYTPGYDKQNGMFCWIKECGVSSPPADCFTAPLLCQHGDTECKGNMIMGCAIQLNPVFTTYMPFVTCFEGVNNGNLAAAPKCAQQAGLNWTAISGCTGSSQGTNVVVANAKATLALGSDKAGVPWVLVNGQALGDLDTLLATVCSTYTGTKPAGCSKATPHERDIPLS